MTNLSRRLTISLSVNVLLGLLVVILGSLDRFEHFAGSEISIEKGSSFEEGFSAGSNDPVVSTDRLSDSIETRNEFDESKEESFDEKDFEDYLKEHGFRVVPESIFEKVHFGVLTGEGGLSRMFKDSFHSMKMKWRKSISKLKRR